MSEMEEKLNQLLNDSDTMAKIMQMAQQLSGGTAPPPPSPQESSSDSGLDAATLAKLLPLFNELKAPNAQATQLLYALRPYLKEDKQEKVDRAVKLAHLIAIGKRAIRDWGLDFV